MPLELRDVARDTDRYTVLPGDRGLLILAKVRGLRNVHKEALKKLKAFAELYYKEKCPEKVDITDNAQGDGESEPTKKENGVESKGLSLGQIAVPIIFQPHDVYENCTFFGTNLSDPSDFAHFFLSRMADNPGVIQPKYPLRVMPVQVVCKPNQKAIETAIMPVLEETFGGDGSVRVSFVLHSKVPCSDMTLHEAEAIVRNCLWSINPNCVQCLKYQDFAIMIEIINPLILIGIAKDYNQLGRFNTASVIKGRDLKEQMDDSEDDISDNPNLSDEGNMKRKLEIKRKRRLERAEEAKKAKLAKTLKEDDGINEKGDDVKEEELNGEKE